jgi:hypothetical protein
MLKVVGGPEFGRELSVAALALAERAKAKEWLSVASETGKSPALRSACAEPRGFRHYDQ